MVIECAARMAVQCGEERTREGPERRGKLVRAGPCVTLKRLLP